MFALRLELFPSPDEHAIAAPQATKIRDLDMRFIIFYSLCGTATFVPIAFPLHVLSRSASSFCLMAASSSPSIAIKLILGPFHWKGPVGMRVTAQSQDQRSLSGRFAPERTAELWFADDGVSFRLGPEFRALLP